MVQYIVKVQLKITSKTDSKQPGPLYVYYTDLDTLVEELKCSKNYVDIHKHLFKR